jgi:hypothetical protein
LPARHRIAAFSKKRRKKIKMEVRKGSNLQAEIKNHKKLAGI